MMPLASMEDRAATASAGEACRSSAACRANNGVLASTRSPNTCAPPAWTTAESATLRNSGFGEFATAGSARTLPLLPGASTSFSNSAAGLPGIPLTPGRTCSCSGSRSLSISCAVKCVGSMAILMLLYYLRQMRRPPRPQAGLPDGQPFPISWSSSDCASRTASGSWPSAITAPATLAASERRLAIARNKARKACANASPASAEIRCCIMNAQAA